MTPAEKIQTTKNIVRLVVGSSTGFAVASLIKTYTPQKNNLQKVQASVAGFAVGGVVAKKTEQYTDDMIDEIVKGWADANHNKS